MIQIIGQHEKDLYWHQLQIRERFGVGGIPVGSVRVTDSIWIWILCSKYQKGVLPGKKYLLF
jgi:hypothetical protein